MTEATRPRVFVPQHPSKFNFVTRQSENVGDMSGLLNYGHPIFMLPRGQFRYGQLRNLVRWLEKAMFDYKESDFLVAVGDPVVISAAVLVAARRVNGPLNIIRWMRQTNEFKVFPLHTRGKQ